MSFTWSEPITAGTIIKADHQIEMQNNIDSIYDNIQYCGTHNSGDDSSKNTTVDSSFNTTVDSNHDATFNTDHDSGENGTHYGTIYATNNDTHDNGNYSAYDSDDDESVVTCSTHDETIYADALLNADNIEYTNVDDSVHTGYNSTHNDPYAPS